MGVPRAVALVLATGLARHPAGLSRSRLLKDWCCGVGRSAEIRTRDPQSPRQGRGIDLSPVFYKTPSFFED